MWNDRCDRRQRLQVFVVTPAPPEDAEARYIHVLVLQSPVEGYVPILTSAKTRITHPWEHSAYHARQSINKFAMLSMMGLGPMCYGGNSRRTCHAWHKNALIAANGEVLAEAGDSFRVLVEESGPPTALFPEHVPELHRGGHDQIEHARQRAGWQGEDQRIPLHVWFVHHGRFPIDVLNARTH